MDLSRFLNRIQYQGHLDCTLETLTVLQDQFLQTVPFENLDIMQGVALDFTPEPIYQKIVERRRGGVCYENNSLFHWALVVMGFDAKIIRAEMFPGATFRNHFDHMAVIVSISY